MRGCGLTKVVHVSRFESTSFAELTASSISVGMCGVIMATSSLILGSMSIRCKLALIHRDTCVSCCYGDYCCGDSAVVTV